MPPIIDYHILRSCLRVGLIDVVDEELNKKLSNRQIVTAAEEKAVRAPRLSGDGSTLFVVRRKRIARQLAFLQRTPTLPGNVRAEV